MKKILSAIILIIACILHSYSQDIIYTTSGDEIICNVNEIFETSIKYKYFHQPEGPIRNIYKNQVIKIKYEDGTIEYFKSIEDKNKPEDNIASTFTDKRNGYEYPITKIGDQWWLGENLNYNSNQSWCYENRKNNCEIIGRLYTWEAAVNACPDGWHLPSDEDWKELEINLGMIYNVDKNGWRGNSPGQGKQLRVNKDIGFNARLAGYRYLGAYDNYRKRTYFWTSTGDGNKDKAYVRELGTISKIKRTSYNKDFAFSVRCVQGDTEPTKQPIKEDKKTKRFYKNNQHKYLSVGIGTGPGYGAKYGLRFQQKRSFGNQGYAIHFGGGISDKLQEYNDKDPRNYEGAYISIGCKYYFYRSFYIDMMFHNPSYIHELDENHLLFENIIALAGGLGFETSISKDFDFCASAAIMDIGNRKWSPAFEVGINWKIIK